MQRATSCCLLLMLAACSGEPGGPPREPPAPEAGVEAGSVIGEPLQQSLDKARAVEDLAGQRQGDVDAAVEGAD